MKRDPLHHVLDYFGYFSYPPTFEEIHTFIASKISRAELQKKLTDGVKNGVFEAQGQSLTRYAFKGKFKYFDLIDEREGITEVKIEKVSGFVNLLNRVPFLLLTGISGSVAMKNAKLTDDIDIFIITIPGRMWTARFCAVVLASLFGMRRKRGDRNVSDKICLNLFFDGADIAVPEHKRNEYVAHEVLQLRPLLNRATTYERFLHANSWVMDYFPNAVLPQKVTIATEVKGRILGWVGDQVESALRNLQLAIMKPHQTTEIISSTQLWFYPKDFEQTLKKHIPIRDVT